MSDAAREHRLEVAREGLRGWEAFLNAEDPTAPIDLQVVSKLATCTQWLVELLTEDNST